jgi:hypothetical protein
MFFWNRVEIYCGFSLKDFSELRDALAGEGIRYDYKLVNQTPNRVRFGSFGQNQKYDVLYYLYVHQKDYDRAMHLTSNRHNAKVR